MKTLICKFGNSTAYHKFLGGDMRLSQLMVGCAANHANAYYEFTWACSTLGELGTNTGVHQNNHSEFPWFGSPSNAQSTIARLVLVVVLLGFLMRVGCGQSLETREAARARQRGLVRKKNWLQ